MPTSSDIREERFINQRRRTRGSHDGDYSSSQVIRELTIVARPEHLFSAGDSSREALKRYWTQGDHDGERAER